jgi:glycine/D-amino acid oxidase-like deaminating enzyme
VVGGAKHVRYGYGSTLPPAEHRETFDLLEQAFRDRFPTLRHIPVRHFWSGWLGFTPDFLPSLGVSGEHRNVHHAIGFAGHGVAQATLMGEMVAEQIQGRRHPLAQALERRTWSWPPEPLRWLAFQAINGTLHWIDARTDRQLHRPDAPKAE